MSDTAAQAEPDLSPDTTEGEQPEAAPVTDWQAEATEYKNRFAGSQKRLNEEIENRRKLEAEVEALRKFKAETERASMSELERLQAEIRERDEALAAARAEAERERLARQFPLAVEFYGDEPLPSTERLKALQERLAAAADEETEPEPRIDPNNPRRQPAPVSEEAAQKAALDEIDQFLRAQAANL